MTKRGRGAPFISRASGKPFWPRQLALSLLARTSERLVLASHLAQRDELVWPMASRRDAPGDRAATMQQWVCTGKCGGCPNYITRGECRACGAKAPPSILAALKACQPLGLGNAPWRDRGAGPTGPAKPQGKAKAKPKGRAARGAQWASAKDWRAHFVDNAGAGEVAEAKSVANFSPAELLEATNKMLVAAGKDALTEGQLSVVAPEPPKQEMADIASKPLSQVLQRKSDKNKQVEKCKVRVQERAQELAAAQEAYDAELRQLREHEAKLAELEAIEKTKCAEAAMGAQGTLSVAHMDQLALLLDALGKHDEEGQASLAAARAVAAKAKEKFKEAERVAAAAKDAPSPGPAPAGAGPRPPPGASDANGGMDVEVPDFEVDEDLADLVAAEVEKMGGSRPTYDLGKPEDVDKLKRAAPKLLGAAVLQAKRQKL